MDNSIAMFLKKNRIELKRTVKEYLIGKRSHYQARSFAWDVIKEWESLSVKDKHIPYYEGEHVFWAIIWTLQHLADEEHWKEQITQRELQKLFRLMENQEDLPEEYVVIASITIFG